MRRLGVASFLVLVASTLLVACGGGGGGGSTVAPPPPVTPTPTVTATPSPLPMALGTVRDLGAQRFTNDGNVAGAPIVGATVIVGSVLISSSASPTNDPIGDTRAVTKADGSFAVTGFTAGSPTYIMVFPAAGDPHVALHAQAKTASSQALFLYAPTTAETAELVQINADRSSNGVGPVSFDEIAFETARAHADFMASNGYYAHCIPMSNCGTGVGTPPTSFPPQYASPDDLYSYLGGALPLPPATSVTENFIFNVTSWSAADAYFMAEKGTATHGHYDQIVFPSHMWVGLGDNQAPRSPATFGLYLQEFY